MDYPPTIVPPPPMGNDRDIEEVKDYVFDIVNDRGYVAIFCTDKTSPLVMGGPLRDANYKAKVVDINMPALSKGYRDMWLRFPGTFVDPDEVRQLKTPNGTLIDFGKMEMYEDTFVNLFGGHAYNFWPHNVLMGPRLWRGQLTQEEKSKRNSWVDAVQHIQSLFDDVNYDPPLHIDEVSDIWFRGNSCPETQVYVHNGPELNERELDALLLTWGGMLWAGNPTILARKHLYEENYHAQGEDIYVGVTVVRFASKDLAELYIKYMNGLKVQYSNFYLEQKDFIKLTPE